MMGLESLNRRNFEELTIKPTPHKLISSRHNPLVKRLRALSDREGREHYSLLLLEGTQLLKEALRTSYLPSEIIATSSWLEKHFATLHSLPVDIPFFEVSASVLQAALTTKNPDGVASLFPLSALPKLEQSADFILALDRLQDPGNLGTLFRTALAAEVQVVWLASGADPLNQKVLRASSGAVLHLPYERLGGSDQRAVGALVEKLELLVIRGFQVVGSFVSSPLSSNSILPYWELDWSKPTVLVLGNEGSGIHPRIKACCTHLLTLPHSSLVESLNVASAAVPLLLERRRAKMSKEAN